MSRYGSSGQRPYEPRGSFMRRVFAGDNPLSWSLPIAKLFGIVVRVSLLYAVWMGIELAQRPTLDQALAIGLLFVMVLLHEFGHCFAARRVGGDADQILMWPLGGLAYVQVPHNWKAHLIVAAGGPLVNVVLLPVLGGVLLALHQPWDVVLFNVLNPNATWSLLKFDAAPELAVRFLFWAHVTNFYLLAFNVLLPMYPMDGGRITQAILWRFLGYRKSLAISVTIGLVIAIGLGLFALATGQMILFGIAVFGGLTCVSERMRLRFMDEPRDEPWAASARMTDREIRRQPPAPSRREVARAEKERAARVNETAELDRILAKIKDKGMASLTKSEESFLRETRERMNNG